jgi:hypothetical protein
MLNSLILVGNIANRNVFTSQMPPLEKDGGAPVRTRIACRIRRPNVIEAEGEPAGGSLHFSDLAGRIVVTEDSTSRSFAFEDGMFGHGKTNQQVFEKFQGVMVGSLGRGEDFLWLMLGATAAGKSYTLFGQPPTNRATGRTSITATPAERLHSHFMHPCRPLQEYQARELS